MLFGLVTHYVVNKVNTKASLRFA